MIARNFTKRNTPPVNKKTYLFDAPEQSAESPVLRSPSTALRLAQLVVIVGAGIFAGYGQVTIGIFLILCAILAQLMIREYRA